MKEADITWSCLRTAVALPLRPFLGEPLRFRGSCIHEEHWVCRKFDNGTGRILCSYESKKVSGRFPHPCLANVLRFVIASLPSLSTSRLLTPSLPRSPSRTLNSIVFRCHQRPARLPGRLTSRLSSWSTSPSLHSINQ